MYCSKCGKKMVLSTRCYCENIEDGKWYNCKVKLDEGGNLIHFPLDIKDVDFDIIDWEYTAKCKKCGNKQKLDEFQMAELLKLQKPKKLN